MLKKIDFIMLSVLGGSIVASGYINTSSDWSASSVFVVTAPHQEVALSRDAGETVKPAEALPDFSVIRDVHQKKQAFFDYMKPLVEQENQKVRVLRGQILGLKEKPEMTVSEKQWLMDMAGKYRIDVGDQFDRTLFRAVLARVDIIPVSLALAQSANESAWGTSRFAVEGHNLFGQWCFSKGCGLVPSGRPAGASYEVRRFATVSDSVRAYIHNLNTHPNYQEMRDIRLERRLLKEPVTGPSLAEGLHAYSIRGEDYVNELTGMIASNGLLKYDLKGQAPST
ncbi:glucosaminidase domain-containing protein [Endozoicomonas sp. Mp262]|uniref:glucosaminidase domain-containing protein n=1 Tax=Endozoicomonas sp. Mp262 TaxID=2919499 RepID=UPI0021DA5D1F